MEQSNLCLGHLDKTGLVDLWRLLPATIRLRSVCYRVALDLPDGC